MIKWVEVKFDEYHRIYSYKCKSQKVKKGMRLLVHASGRLMAVTCIRVHKTEPPKIATAKILSDLRDFQ